MANEQELKIKIITMAEKVGLEQSAKALEKLDQKAVQTDKSAKNTADSLNIAGAAAAAASGNFTALGGALSSMAAKFGLSMTSVSVVGVALTALVGIAKAVKTGFDNAAKSLRDIKFDNMQSSLNSLADAQARYNIEAERDNAIRLAGLQHASAVNDARKTEALALNELAKQKELNNAKSDDERAIIEARYKKRSDSISAVYDAAQGQRDKAALTEQADQYAQDKNNAIGNRNDALATAAEAGKEVEHFSKIMQSTNSVYGRFINNMGFSSDRKNAAERLKQAAATMEKAKAEALKYDQEAAAKSQLEEETRRAAEVQDRKNRTLKILTEAQDMANTRATDQANTTASENAKKAADDERAKRNTDIAGLDASRQKNYQDQDRADLERQLSALELLKKQAEERQKTKGSELNDNFTKERREYDDALGVAETYRRKGDTRNYQKAMKEAEKQRAEAEAAAAELAEFTATMTATLKSLTESVRNLNEQIKRVGQ